MIRVSVLIITVRKSQYSYHMIHMYVEFGGNNKLPNFILYQCFRPLYYEKYEKCYLFDMIERSLLVTVGNFWALLCV